MRRTCVIDNSTLVNLTKLRDLRIFDLLRTIFASIHIPAKVFQEYQQMSVYDPERNNVIRQIRLDGAGFLVYCNRYDSIVFEILRTEKGIDAGEAEATAQHKSLLSHFVLSDDLKFINAISGSDKQVRVITSLHLIAWLDLAQIIDSSIPYLKRLYRFHGFTDAQLSTAYQDIIKYLGISFPKNELSKRTSIARLGILRNL